MKFVVTAVCVALIFLGCKREPPKAPPMELVLEPLGAPGSVRKNRDLSRPEAHLVMASKSAIGGPCVALAATAATAFGVLREQGTRSLVALPLSGRGLPQAGSVVLGAVAADLGSMACGTTKNTNVVAFSQLLDRGESIVTSSVSIDSKTVRGPSELMRTAHHVAWLRVVSGSKRTALFWVEEQADGHASLLAVLLNDAGSAGMAVRLASDVVGWHVQAHGDGFAAAWIVNAPKMKLIAQRYTDTLAQSGLQQLVTTADQFRGDLYGDSSGDFLVLAWSEGKGSVRSRVSVLSQSAVGEPISVDQEPIDLAGIVGAPGGAYVVWRPTSHRDRVRVARLRAREETLAAALEIEAEPAVPIEVVGLQSGLSILGSFRVCPSARCADDVGFAKAMVRVAPSLQVSEVHPLTVPIDRTEGPPALSWSLRCSGEDCVSLSATGGDETRVFVHDLGPRASLYGLAGKRDSRPNSVAQQGHSETILDDVPVVDYAATGSGDARAIAQLREPEGKRAKHARGLDVVLDVWSPRKTFKLATGASPTGQIALARDLDGSLVVMWVESDRSASALRLMRVANDGRVLRDTRLSPSGGDKARVTLVRVPDSKNDRKWLLFWIDSRRRHGEVYGMALNEKLRRIAPESRLFESGDVDGIGVRLDEASVWLAWTARVDSDRDVFFGAVHWAGQTRPFEISVAPRKVAATVTDSHAPHFRLEGDALSIVWVERPIGGLGSKDRGAYGAWNVSVDRATGTLGSPEVAASSASVVEAFGDDHGLWIVRGAQSLAVERLGQDSRVFPLSAEAPFEPIVQAIDSGVYVLDTGSKPALRKVKFMRP